MIINKYVSEIDKVTAMAENFKQRIGWLLQDKETVTVAVSGGKSPVLLFEHLGRQKLPWHRITITLVDERIVDEYNINDSNAYLVQAHLLQGYAKEAKFHRLIDPAASATELDASIAKLNAHPPIIDIAILGMGDDGHTASIFPDCQELQQALTTSKHYLLTTPTQANYQRISLSLHALALIPWLILSINGNTKLRILEQALIEKSDLYPISYLFAARKHAHSVDAKTHNVNILDVSIPDVSIYWNE